ncbi:MAG TPA: AraC family transcriptional regulator [Bacteroidales bacterium]|nr:AraC family transcriptional regulator [Bacteroidales bacterium]
MVAELEKISFDDNGGFRAVPVSDSGTFWHFHPEYELALSIKSKGTRIIGDSVELFDEYDMVFIAGNIPHCWNYNRAGKNNPDKHSIILHFKLSSIGEAFLSQYELNSFRKLLSEAERGIAFPVEDAKMAEKYLIFMTVDSGIDKMIDFFQLIRIMVNSKNRCFICSDNYKLSYDERGNKRMADVYTFIRENYFRHISLEKISRIAKMNPVAFSRYFKENYGTGFIEYLNRTRTNKACYLLRETDYQIHEIAEECGFGSISNFNKRFRKMEGRSPKNYRTQFKN